MCRRAGECHGSTGCHEDRHLGQSGGSFDQQADGKQGDGRAGSRVACAEERTHRFVTSISPATATLRMQIEPLDTREKVRDAIHVHGRGWQEAYDGLVPDDVLASLTVDPSPGDVERWLDRLPEEGGVALGAVVDGTVRGYINLRWAETKPFVGPDEAGLKEIYVHPDWWGDGLGTALFEAGRDRLPDDVAGIALEMLADNDVGRQFYEARGFEVDDHGTYEIAGEPYETVIFRREV